MGFPLFQNLKFQTYLQIINTIIPLITTPYIARVLGAMQVGFFSYTTSIAAFFTLFELLGTTTYGMRAIAAETDKNKRRETFAEIYLLQLITCLISTLCYLIYLVICNENNLIATLQLITLLGYFFDISWFYFGIEDFKAPVQWNLFFRCLSFSSLFIFVRNSEDLWIYTVIMLSSTALGHIVLWGKLARERYIMFKGVCLSNIIKHLKPNIILFIPLMAMTIYHSTDKIMLGVLSTYEQAGYYYNVDKVINVPFSIFTGIGTVLLPRMTVLFQENQNKAQKFFFDSLSGVMMFGCAICFGIISLAKDFIPFFLGTGYDECVFLVIAFAPIIIVKCISNTIRMQYLIPLKQELIYIKAILTGATINVIFNFILIPKHGALGAEITTIISEVVALFIQLPPVFDGYKYLRTAVNLLVYVVIGFFMFFLLKFFDGLSTNVLLNIILKVIFGSLIYCGLTIVYWIISNNQFYILYIKRYFKKKY